MRIPELIHETVTAMCAITGWEIGRWWMRRVDANPTWRIVTWMCLSGLVGCLIGMLLVLYGVL